MTERKGIESSQADKFRELARELECDDNPEAFKAVVRKIARAPRAPVESKKS